MKCLHQVLRAHALRIAVAACVIAPSAPVLAADCAQWNVAGKHTLIQSNVKSGGYMDLQQDGTNFKGSFGYSYLGEPTMFNGQDVYYGSADVVGTVVGNKFEATAYWTDNKVGIYTGQIGPQGLVVGRTYNKNNPAESADWHGSPAFNCLTTSAPGAPANNGNSADTGKPAVALGRVNLQPTIVEPQKGGAYAPQTPLRIRLAAAKGARDTAYRIEIQREKITHSPGSSGFDIEWSHVATINTDANVAQSAAGLLEWGGPGRKDMTATGGIYSVRATAMAPQAGAPTEWVQFKINGPAGRDDAMNQAKAMPQGAGGGAAQSAAARMAGGMAPQPGAVATAAKPSIAEPVAGGTYPSKTPLRVRIVPAKDAKDTGYRIEIQRGGPVIWHDVTAFDVPAAVAQSAQGYQAWGGAAAGARPDMTATVGHYRMRASVPPNGALGEWVQFSIDGQPGPQDAMNQPKAGAPNALANAPAAATQAKAAPTLTGQTLTPRSLGGAAALNPQPLPPKTSPAPAGNLQQAPSSLR